MQKHNVFTEDGGHQAVTRSLKKIWAKRLQVSAQLQPLSIAGSCE